MTRPAVYLDHNAMTPLLPEARAALLAALETVGNPSSVHAHGRAARDIVERARAQVAALAGAERRDVVFTGSASEAVAQAIIGGSRALGVDGVLVGAAEHASVLRSAEATGLPTGMIDYEPDGTLNLASLRAALADASGRTLLVCVSAINGETGVIQPLEAISALVGPTRHVLFVDFVQAFGRLPLAFSSSAPDMVAVSAPKIGGAPGAGAVLMKSHADGACLVPGGGQETNRRGGTEAVPAIAAFGAAAEAYGTHHDGTWLRALRDDFETRLLAFAPDAVIFGAGTDRSANTSMFAVPGLQSAVAMMGLDLAGVSASSGSACASGKVGRSHVLAAMGVDPALAASALRVSFGWTSAAADIDAFHAAFGPILARARSHRAA